MNSMSKKVRFPVRRRALRTLLLGYDIGLVGSIQDTRLFYGECSE